MAYRWNPQQTPQTNLRRIADSQSKKALQALADNEPHQAVHEYRKYCKKLRGLLRLVRPALGDTYRDENTTLRDAARSLSNIRDASAHLETIDALREHYPELLAQPPLTDIEQALADARDRAAQEQDLAARLERARHSMEGVRERARGWQLDTGGFEAVGGGLQKTYKRARKALDHAYSEQTVEAFHEWRKRAKYHRYHMHILEPLWPDVLTGRRESAHLLSDLLGDDHDLAELQTTLMRNADAYGGTKTVQALLPLIERRRAELQIQALPLGRKLFAEKPQRFVTRIKSYWYAAQTEERFVANL